MFENIMQTWALLYVVSIPLCVSDCFGELIESIASWFAGLTTLIIAVALICFIWLK